jgi:hypothetical protein
MPLFWKGGKAALYIHVPKTGGTAVTEFFKRNGFAVGLMDSGGEGSLNNFFFCPPQHLHADILKRVIKLGTVDYVVMTVRNPLDRIVSEYRMRQAAIPGIPPLPRWVKNVLTKYQMNRYVMQNHIRPQSDFILPGCDIVKQEDGWGDAQVSRVEQKMEIAFEFRDVGRENRRVGQAHGAQEMAAIAPMVYKFYRQDYDNFGYLPPDFSGRF